jgi:hypothetical protein
MRNPYYEESLLEITILIEIGTMRKQHNKAAQYEKTVYHEKAHIKLLLRKDREYYYCEKSTRYYFHVNTIHYNTTLIPFFRT